MWAAVPIAWVSGGNAHLVPDATGDERICGFGILTRCTYIYLHVRTTRLGRMVDEEIVHFVKRGAFHQAHAHDGACAPVQHVPPPHVRVPDNIITSVFVITTQQPQRTVAAPH